MTAGVDEFEIFNYLQPAEENRCITALFLTFFSVRTHDQRNLCEKRTSHTCAFMQRK